MCNLGNGDNGCISCINSLHIYFINFPSVLSNSTDPRVSRIEGRIFSLSDFSNRPMMTLSDNIDPVPFNGYLTEFGVTWYHPGRGVQIYLQVWRPRLGSSDYDYIGHKNIVVQRYGITNIEDDNTYTK